MMNVLHLLFYHDPDSQDYGLDAVPQTTKKRATVEP